MRTRFLPPPRLVAAAVVTIIGIWVALAGTLPATIGQRSPALALTVQPFSATALAARAEGALGDGVVSRAAVADARRALALDPTRVKALRVLAVDAMIHGRPERAQQILGYSERLSRRDMLTQLGLIEQRVAANDVAGALIHYDRALRTSRAAAPVLIPILVQAVADPTIVRPLSRMIASRPIWWRDVAASLLAPGPQMAAVRPIYQALRLDPRRPEEASLLAQALNHLVAAERYDDAAALFRQATGQRPGALRNGGFGAPGFGLTPFDWYLNDDPDLSANIDIPDAALGNPVLLLTTMRKAGTAARQLLLLGRGRYSLSFAQGGGTGATVPAALLAVRCATSPERILASQPIGSGTGRMVSDVVVPADCPAQWLSVDVAGSASNDMPWIDDVRIVPAR